jgi:hypothetical protein
VLSSALIAPGANSLWVAAIDLNRHGGSVNRTYLYQRCEPLSHMRRLSIIVRLFAARGHDRFGAVDVVIASLKLGFQFHLKMREID